MTSEEISHQLRALAEMHARGELTDEEFTRAKQVALSSQDTSESSEPSDGPPDEQWCEPQRRSLGRQRRFVLIGAAVVVVAGWVILVTALTGDDVAQVADEPLEETPQEVDLEDGSEEASEVVEEPAEEPEPISPVDLTEADWTQLTWSTTCSDGPETIEVMLSEAAVPWDEPGTIAHNPDPDAEFPGMVYLVDIDNVTFGDVTGDGLDNAVFRTECFLGNDSLSLVEVWGHDHDGQPVHLPAVVEYSKWDGVIEDVEIVDATLRTQTREPEPGDDLPHINGYPIEVVTDWIFHGHRWRVEEVSRADQEQTPPAADGGATTGIDECADPHASSANTVLCLVAAINAQDYATAGTVAADEVVSLLRETREEWGPLDWHFEGCEGATCWFYEPSVDPQFHGVSIEVSVDITGERSRATWIQFYG